MCMFSCKTVLRYVADGFGLGYGSFCDFWIIIWADFDFVFRRTRCNIIIRKDYWTEMDKRARFWWELFGKVNGMKRSSFYHDIFPITKNRFISWKWRMQSKHLWFFSFSSSFICKLDQNKKSQSKEYLLAQRNFHQISRTCRSGRCNFFQKVEESKDPLIARERENGRSNQTVWRWYGHVTG